MSESGDARGGWTRRLLLAVLPASGAALWLLPGAGEARPMPRPETLPGPEEGEVFDKGVFEKDVFE